MGTTNAREIRAANEIYAADFGDKGRLPHDPARAFAVVTCMDCRLDPAKFAGLAEGDAHVIRNAGGRVTRDVIRSLLISHRMLGTTEWFVIQHTRCGMQTFTNEEAQELFATDSGSPEAYYMDFMPIRGSLAENLILDVRRLRSHPLVPPTVTIHGYIYEIETGRLVISREANEIGAALPGGSG